MTGARPTLTVTLMNFGPAPPGGWRRLVELARVAEDAGVHRVAVADHVVMGRDPGQYRWGEFPLPPETDFLEPLTVLTAIATATTTIRLQTSILLAALRPAPLLAKTVATLDVLSGGRVDLGVGTGWQREEYRSQGLSFADRGALLTETIRGCRALWEASADVVCAPSPVQPRLPVWVAGSMSDRVLDRTAALADGWIPIMNATAADVRRGVDRLAGECRRRGRDIAGFTVQTPQPPTDPPPSLDTVLASIPGFLEAGATDVAVPLWAICAEPGGEAEAIRELARRFAAEI